MADLSLPTADFVTTSLQGSLAQGATTGTIGTGLSLPATNGVLQINYDSEIAVGTSNGPETITYATYDSGTGALAGITRGCAGTTDVLHDASAPVQSGPSILYFANQTLTAPNLISPLLKGTIDGWVGANETWTYSSASAITVPAGGLTKYSVGDKLKFNQSIPLQNYWALENNTDSIAGISMTNIGSPTYTAGKFSNAFTSDGNDALQVGSDTTSSNTTMKLGVLGAAFTVGMWVKTSSTGSQKNLFQSWSHNPNYNGIVVCITSSNYIQYLAASNGSAIPTNLVGSKNVCDNNWHYVVVSFQQNFVKIFVDGVLDTSGPATTPTYATTNYVRIGCGNDSGTDITFFTGQIDDLFIINGFAVDQYWVAAKYAAATAQGTSNITATQYMYVTAVADTTLTLTGGADYVPYNGTITSNYYSKASSPVGFPDDFGCNLNPSGWSSFGTNVGRFRILGKTAKLKVFVDGTSNNTTTQVTAPVTARNGSFPYYKAHSYPAVDNGSDVMTGYAYLTKNSTTVLLFKAAGTNFMGSGTKGVYFDLDYEI